MSKWSDIKMYDLTIPIGICTPAWPTYEPLQMKFFKRLTPNGANGQLMTHSNHVGTHLDGPLHFDTAGRDVAFTVTSTDVIHSFWVPRLGGKIDAIPGHRNTIRLRADTPGQFGGVCAERFGGGDEIVDWHHTGGHFAV